MTRGLIAGESVVVKVEVVHGVVKEDIVVRKVGAIVLQE